MVGLLVESTATSPHARLVIGLNSAFERMRSSPSRKNSKNAVHAIAQSTTLLGLDACSYVLFLLAKKWDSDC